MIVIVVGLVVWLLISQMSAWLMVPPGTPQEEDAVLTMWAGIFIIVPIAPIYALVYLMMKAINWQKSLGSDSSVSADEVF